MLYQKGGAGPVVGVNGSGCAPAGLTAESLLERGIDRIGPESAESVTVPGAVDAWCAILDAHGTMAIDRVLQPAIACAEQGFTVGEVTRRLWANRLDGLRGNAAASALYLKDGAPPRPGDVWRSPPSRRPCAPSPKRAATASMPGRCSTGCSLPCGPPAASIPKKIHRTASRAGRAARIGLSRPHGAGNPAERRRHHRTDHAQYPGRLRTLRPGPGGDGTPASGDGGPAPRLRPARRACR